MPSRKRNKGKERKAKREEKELERIENERVKVSNTWLGWAQGKMGVDEIDVIQCKHGCKVSIQTTDQLHG